MKSKLILKTAKDGYETNPADQSRNALYTIAAMADNLANTARAAAKDTLGSSTYGESVKGAEQHHKAIGLWLERVRQVDALAEQLAQEPDDRGAYGEL
jgi:hypothetical protein